MTDLLASLRFAALPSDTRKLRDDVREFLREHHGAGAPAERARSWMGFDASFSQRLAKRGWVGLTLPKEYGGAGMTPLQRFVIVEQLLSVGAPVAAHWVAERQSGPLILKFGSSDQRDFFLPRICAGEVFFCIGMSEPNSGSDLASVRSRALKVDGGWRLSGRKIWTTNAQHCQYMIALVRTSGAPDDRQKGLSQFIVDMKAPGMEVRPLVDLCGDAHFNEVLLDDVFVPESAMVGQEGQGWAQVNAELAYERSGPERFYSSAVLLNAWLSSLRVRTPERTVSGEELAALGKFATHMVALRQVSVALTTKLSAGESPLVEAALMKDLGTEFEQSVPSVLEAMVGALPPEQQEPELLRALNYLSLMAPSFSLRGGTREILRGMVARGLGLR
ncbi:acyl-CoA dehydrogenase family protein [Variovorax guangxiensis]|uniref:Acyl-CoA dehydrogenase n=1 Tax=Variovorax guangxiensis TaxID=1775474 RepID=A0A502DV69_9BURK|nr:acyl-CoA dehydrogenase family protein [Variovorax guangxiensis]TPG24971.1 acyl-CoA dehydrogenase [Variovorax ginsengisoli]TPG29223.1 acyl-CoA dehydrogenase [Variovorax guangxiensis]